MTTDDDARARALELNRELSKVMEEAQRYGPPSPQSTVARDQSVTNREETPSVDTEE